VNVRPFAATVPTRVKLAVPEGARST